MGITPFRVIPPLTERDRQRFWKKVEKTDGCWLWTGWSRRDGSGYGLFSVSFQTRYGTATGQFSAHRIAYTLIKGPIPPGMDILHSCDVTRCVFPGHLRPGTETDNAADKMARNRHPRGGRIPGVVLPPPTFPTPPAFRGERHVSAKISDAMVHTLREQYARGNVTATELARRVNMSKQAVIGMLTGRGRKTAGGPVGPIRPIFGQQVPNSKMTEEKIAAMRGKFAASLGTIYDLATEYGIAPQTVSNIIRGRTWKHVAPVAPDQIRPGHHKLTKAQVTTIRQRFAKGVSVTRLARDHGVSHGAISLVVHLKTHVPSGV